MPHVLVVVKREKKLLTPDGVAQWRNYKHRAVKEWGQPKMYGYI